MTKKAEREAQIEANKRVAYIKKVKGLVVFMFGRGLDGIVEAMNAGVSAEDFALSIVVKSPVGSAVHALKVEAMDRSRKYAAETAEKALTKLAEADWNITAIAPRPHWNSNRYKEEVALNNFYMSFVSETDRSYMPKKSGEPVIVARNDEKIARFVDNAEANAAEQYDMFICKLVSKVGECDSATLDGNHVWGNSVLTVVKGDRSERWHTQQIVNVSKLGTVFNQWPTRLQK